MNKQELIEYAEQQVADYESKARLFPEAREYAVREYAEGAISGTALLISEIKKLDEPKKVKVPLFVAKWISKCRELNWILPDLLAPEAFESSFARNTEEWLRQDKHNYDILARAWLDGYEVEEEPKWVVKRKDNGKYVESLALGKGIGLIAETTASLQENAYKLNSKDQADAVAVLIDGTVEKV
ncbi:DUF1642 domain-containing protein [Enterococcus sp. K18_3]|uniref:DUF1642 domain-containing protein n=1 Tax=Enterococcus sp. K18_3 TaxID=2718932 RepID=UPI001C8C8C8F|nr:DUF1642 domain-containing protein [Enterococcus sp. K18_3]MBX9123697.1 DUF1642 domain-containing protein [Enterococcus sp. K18_3]